jgi:hypothetical protein
MILFFLTQSALIVLLHVDLLRKNKALEDQINNAVQQISFEVGCRMGDDTACDIIRRGVIAD